VVLSMRWTSISNYLEIGDSKAAGLVAFVTLGFVSFASFYPNLQYLRIISPASGAYCLLAGLGLWFLVSLVRASTAGSIQYGAAVAVGTAILVAGIYDYQSFTKVVVRSGMEELSVYGIRTVMNR